MKAEENKIAADNGAATSQDPFFTEEAEVEARPVVPLSQSGGAPTGSVWSRLPRSLALVLAVVAAGAAGAVAGLVFARQAPTPQVEATAVTSPEPSLPPPTANIDPDTSSVAASGQLPNAESPASDEREHVTQKRVGGREPAKEEVAESRKEGARRREYESGRAERQFAEADKRSRRDDNDEKRGKPKARLVGVITSKSRP